MSFALHPYEIRCFRVLLFIPLCLTACVPTARAEDWYRWRGPALDGISRESDWSSDWNDSQPPIAWSLSVGIGFSSIVVQDGLAYTIGYENGQDVVHCINVDSGKIKWKFRYAAELDDRDFEGGPTSTPTIDGQWIYVLSRAGDLYCLSADTGSQRWHTQVAEAADVRLPGWGCSAAPLVIGDKLLLNLGESGVAVDKQQGELLWASDDREAGYAAAVPIPDAPGSTIVLAAGRAIYGVDVESGKQLWSERWLTSFNCNAADPIIHQGKLFVSSGYNRGAALFDISDGEPGLIWKSKEMKNQLHTSILFQDHLYGIDGDMEAGGRLRCVQWSTGKVVWSVDDLRPGGLMIADGKLVVLAESGELLLAPASPNGWMPTATRTIPAGKYWTGPVLSDGRIFCRSVEGLVVCVDCRE